MTNFLKGLGLGIYGVSAVMGTIAAFSFAVLYFFGWIIAEDSQSWSLSARGELEVVLQILAFIVFAIVALVGAVAFVVFLATLVVGLGVRLGAAVAGR